jgi:hypothetical protein
MDHRNPISDNAHKSFVYETDRALIRTSEHLAVPTFCLKEDSHRSSSISLAVFLVIYGWLLNPHGLFLKLFGLTELIS